MIISYLIQVSFVGQQVGKDMQSFKCPSLGLSLLTNGVSTGCTGCHIYRGKFFSCRIFQTILAEFRRNNPTVSARMVYRIYVTCIYSTVKLGFHKHSTIIEKGRPGKPDFISQQKWDQIQNKFIQGFTWKTIII